MSGRPWCCWGSPNCNLCPDSSLPRQSHTNPAFLSPNCIASTARICLKQKKALLPNKRTNKYMLNAQSAISECASWALMGTAWPTSLTLVITLCIFPNLFSHLKEVFRKPGNVRVVQHRGVLHEVPTICPPLPLTLFHVANDKACL